MSKSSYTNSGHALWSKMPKANAELFALTYGSLVTELLRDYENPAEVNTQLERIGHSIGIRCVDELLAKAEINGLTIPVCTNLRDTADVIAKIGFRMFLGVSCDVGNYASDGSAFSLYLYDNPLATFVELPETAPSPSQHPGSNWNNQILYSNVYCGIIRGSLEQVNLKVECKFVMDMLRGDEVNEIRVELKEVLTDGAGDDYKEE